MPHDCLDCDFAKSQFYDRTIRCCVPSEESFGENVTNYVSVRPPFCPLVEVKTPHGRLIDADELESKMIKTYRYFNVKFDLAEAETVIEREV